MPTTIEQPAASEELQYTFIPSFAKGVNGSLEAHLIDQSELSAVSNLRNLKGALELDYGYTTRGSTIRGNPRNETHFFKKDGTDFLILTTDLSVYVWDTTEDDWQYVSNGTDTTLTAAASAGATTITVASITGFADGESIGVKLDSGKQHKTTVSGSPSGSTITLADAIPTGEAAAIGNKVVEAVLLAGVTDSGVYARVVPSHDWLVIVNGVNTPKRFDGSTCIDIPGLPSGVTTFVAKLVEVFHGYLCFLNVIENGVEKPQKIVRSDTGDPTNLSSGNAGSDNLFQSQGEIRAVSTLGPYMIVYKGGRGLKSHNIVRIEHVGTTDKIFQIDNVVENAGAVSGGAVVSVNDVDYVMDVDKIYRYSGGFDIDILSNNINHLTFMNDGDLNPERTGRVFGIFVKELREVWFFYPTGTNDIPTKVARYSIDNKSFLFRTFLSVVGASRFTPLQPDAWEDYTTNWEDWDLAWGQVLYDKNTDHILLFGNNARVYIYDFSQTQDNGADIAWSLETKNFFVPNKQLRIDRVEFRGKGTITVQFSKDGGSTYTAFTGSPFSLGSTLTTKKIFGGIVTDEFMIKFSGTGSPANIGWVGFRAKEESTT